MCVCGGGGHVSLKDEFFLKAAYVSIFSEMEGVILWTPWTRSLKGGGE